MARKVAGQEQEQEQTATRPIQKPVAYHSWLSRYIAAPGAIIGALIGPLAGIIYLLVSIPNTNWPPVKIMFLVLMLAFLGGVFIGLLRVAYLAFYEGIVARADRVELINLSNGFKRFKIGWNEIDRFDSVATPLGIPRPAMILKDGTILYLPLAGWGIYPYRMSRIDPAEEAEMMRRLNQLLDQTSPRKAKVASAEAFSNQGIKQYRESEKITWRWAAVLLIAAVLANQVFPDSAIPKLLIAVLIAAFLVFYLRKRKKTIYIRSEDKEKAVKDSSTHLSMFTKVLLAVTGFILLAAIAVSFF